MLARMKFHLSFLGQFLPRYYMQKSQHLKIIIHYNNDTDNRTRNLKKILTSEFFFTMKMYWKHRFLVWMDKLKQYHEKIYNKAEQSGLKFHPD